MSALEVVPEDMGRMLADGRKWRKAAAAKRPTSERVINGLSTWLEPDISHLLIHRNNAPMALLFNTDRAKRFRLRISSDLMPCQSAQMLRGSVFRSIHGRIRR
jgi:hypothetical protein